MFHIHLGKALSQIPKTKIDVHHASERLVQKLTQDFPQISWNEFDHSH